MSENHATPQHDSDLDLFWVERRAKHLAEKSTSADPKACGTCRDSAEAGKPVKHEECQQRATLLEAPDHPDYEILAGFSLEENAKLPARFHVPVFDDCGKPNAWLCAVCWEEGVVTGWPCATAVKYGTKVFSPLHEAETAQKKMHAAADELKAENDRLKEQVAGLEDDRVRLLDRQAKDDAEFAQAMAERDRYRSAWQSARFRAQAYGEGVQRVVKDRESYQDWLAKEQAATQHLRTELQRHVTANLEAAERAQQEIDRLRALRNALTRRLHDAAMARVWTNEDGKKFVFADDIKGPLLGLKPEVA